MKRGNLSTNQMRSQLAVMSELVNRMGLAAQLNIQTFSGDRQIYDALGYPKELTFKDYFSRYDRQDMAKAIIDTPVKATWQGAVTLVESDDTEDTELEKAWKDLWHDRKLKSVFNRLDKLTGLGRYGVLLFGMSDVGTIEDYAQPLIGNKSLELLYLKPFSENSAEITTYVTDTKSKRYGLPLMYELTMAESEGGGQQTIKVHYSRVLHIVDDILESEIEGTPRLKNVFNRLIDLEKLVGGSAEMFWKGARPGYSANVDKDFQLTAKVKDDLRTQFDEMEHSLRRILFTKGVKYDSLATQVEDPKNHVDVQIQMISAVTRIPKRILTGSERGELSSAQDSLEWKSYVNMRQEEYAEPSIIRTFVDKCIELKILPEAGERYRVKWPDQFALTEKEKVEIGKARADALKAYAANPAIMMSLPFEAFLKFFLGLTPEEVEMIDAMVEEAKKEESIITPEEQALLDAEAAALLAKPKMVRKPKVEV